MFHGLLGSVQKYTPPPFTEQKTVLNPPYQGEKPFLGVNFLTLRAVMVFLETLYGPETTQILGGKSTGHPRELLGLSEWNPECPTRAYQYCTWVTSCDRTKRYAFQTGFQCGIL